MQHRDTASISYLCQKICFDQIPKRTKKKFVIINNKIPRIIFLQHDITLGLKISAYIKYMRQKSEKKKKLIVKLHPGLKCLHVLILG